VATNENKKLSLRLNNLIIFLTAAAVIARCSEIYAGDSLRMSAISLYITVFLAPLFSFVVGILAKPLTRGARPPIGSLAFIGAAFIMLKALGLFMGVYLYKQSFLTALTAADQSWVLLALIVWIIAAWVLRNVTPAIIISAGAVVGIAAGFLPSGALADTISKILVFLPFFMAGNFANEKKLQSLTQKRWAKITALFIAVLLAVTALITIAYANSFYGIFKGEIVQGDPVFKVMTRLASYIISSFVAALFYIAIPGRSIFFTGFAKRAFQVFFLYWIIIDLWLHLNMNSIFGQIWAEHWKLFFFVSIALLMVFITIIPLPVFSRYIDRIYSGRWRLPNAGDPVYKRFKQYSFLFSELVKRDFKQKYKRTVLGMLWSVLSPLLTLLVMWLVFSEFFGRNTAHYVVFIFSGNLVYSYFRESTNEGMSSLVGNSGIFTKVNVPKYLFLFSKNISSLISFGLTLIVFFIFVAADGLPFTWKFLLLLFPICCLVIFNVGIGLILSALFVFFKDIKYLWSIFTLLLMYMSAIFYKIDSYSATAQNLFLLNPVYVYIRYFRKIVIEGTVPTLWFHLLAIGYAVFFFYLGFHMYKKNNTKFLYYV
jgi:ABC-2 type transport system permease protein